MLSSRARTINGCRGGADYTHSSPVPAWVEGARHRTRGRRGAAAAAPATRHTGVRAPRAPARHGPTERRPAARQPHVDAPCAAHSRAPQCRAEHCFPRSSFADGWRRVWLPVGDADPDALDYALPSAQAPMSSVRPAARHDVNSVPNRDGISLLRPLRFIGIHSLRPLKVIQHVKGDLLVG